MSVLEGMRDREYIGDSVYVGNDGWGIVICTNNGFDDENKIYLEPAVVDNLIEYLRKIRAYREETHDNSRG